MSTLGRKLPVYCTQRARVVGVWAWAPYISILSGLSETVQFSRVHFFAKFGKRCAKLVNLLSGKVILLYFIGRQSLVARAWSYAPEVLCGSCDDVLCGGLVTKSYAKSCVQACVLARSLDPRATQTKSMVPRSW